LELGYGEIKTDMLDRLESIRCRTVAGVEQGLWGILLAYNLIRLEMERTANDFGVEPTRISFSRHFGSSVTHGHGVRSPLPALCLLASRPCENSSPALFSRAAHRP